MVMMANFTGTSDNKGQLLLKRCNSFKVKVLEFVSCILMVSLFCCRCVDINRLSLSTFKHAFLMSLVMMSCVC